MSELDRWTESVVIDPLIQDWHEVEYAEPADADRCQQHLIQTVADIKKAIREKVLESYKNGLKATPRTGFNKPRRQFSK